MQPYNPPTARYNRDTGEIEYLEGGAPPPSPSYSEGQVSVKGHLIDVLIPHALAGKAEAAGVPLRATVQVGALRALRTAIEATDRPGPDDRLANSAEAALHRGLLGVEIHNERKRRRMSRRTFAYLLAPIVDRIPGETHLHGWSSSSVQAWEKGVAAPRQIEPIITVLEVGPEQAERWRGWWSWSRRGAERTGEPEPVTYETALGGATHEADEEQIEADERRAVWEGDENAEAILAAQEAELVEFERQALERLDGGR